MATSPLELPQLVQQHKDSAAAHILQGRPEQALADFRKVLELDPKDTVARLRVAELLVQTGLRQDAVREYQQLAFLYAAVGQTLQAIASCKIILAIDPSHQATLENLANLCAKQSHREHSDTGAQARASTPLFSELPRDVFIALLGVLKMHRVRGGERIITEGERGTSMFILVQGTVRVVHTPDNGPERTLAELGEGAFFGEMGLMSDAPRVASVVATRDCTLLEVTREALDRLGGRYPEIELVMQRFYKDRMLDNLVRSNPLFQPLSAEEKQFLIERFETRGVEAGTVLLQQGQRSQAFYLLLRGRCAVVHEDPKGGERPYPDMTEGAIFGEISLMLDLRVTATVRALTPCVLLMLDPETFRERVLPNPGVRRMLMRITRERLDRTTALLAEGAEVQDFFLL